jgi:hypothetical protein
MIYTVALIHWNYNNCYGVNFKHHRYKRNPIKRVKMKKYRKALFRLAAIIALALTVSSCGWFWRGG